jgi:hypothetical protein
MRILLLAGVALLSACGGGETNTSDANTMGTDNMLMDGNMMMDGNMAMDPNMSMNGMDMNGAAMGANGAMDANTQNMMAQDMNTNAPDTNLANGL